MIQAATAPATGLIPIMSPKATPAREVWESASPIMESRFNTITTPMQGITMASRIPTTKAFCIKA